MNFRCVTVIHSAYQKCIPFPGVIVVPLWLDVLYEAGYSCAMILLYERSANTGLKDAD